MAGPRGMLCLMLMLVVRAVHGKCNAKFGSLVSNTTVGVQGNDSRILGGSEAKVSAYSYMVFVSSTLADSTTVTCGGALLTDSYVVTSAQCVFQSASIDVYYGITDGTTATSQTTKSSGTAIIYPNFRRYSLIHDIALIKLISSISFSSGTASAVTLPKGAKASFANKLDNYNVRTLGYGYTSSTATALSTTLQYVDQTQMSRSLCDTKMLEKWIAYPSSMSCLDSSSAVKGQCSGDLGGPVLYKFSGSSSYVLVGVISDVTYCETNYPGAYTRIQPYLSWISSQVKGLTYYS